MYNRPASESWGVKTRIREIRRDVRRLVGTSNEANPSLDATLKAAQQLARMVDLLSGGRYGLAVVRPMFPGEAGQVTRWEIDGQVSGNVATLAHEPISETIRRESQLREEHRERVRSQLAAGA